MHSRRRSSRHGRAQSQRRPGRDATESITIRVLTTGPAGVPPFRLTVERPAFSLPPDGGQDHHRSRGRGWTCASGTQWRGRGASNRAAIVFPGMAVPSTLVERTEHVCVADPLGDAGKLATTGPDDEVDGPSVGRRMDVRRPGRRRCFRRLQARGGGGHFKTRCPVTPRSSSADEMGIASPVFSTRWRQAHAQTGRQIERGATHVCSGGPSAISGAPGGIRTPDHCLRRAVLYPAELRARGAHCNGAGRARLSAGVHGIVLTPALCLAAVVAVDMSAASIDHGQSSPARRTHSARIASIGSSAAAWRAG